MTTVNTNNPEHPYEGLSYLFGLATDWLALSEGANVPLELAVHEMQWRGDWRFSIYRTPENIEGVGVVMPGGDWFLEARGSSAAAFLTKTAIIHGRHPATLTTTENVSALVQPYLSEYGGIKRQQTLLILKCSKRLESQQGRWATDADIPALQKYVGQMERDQIKGMDTSWEGLIARQELAVVSQDDGIVGSIKRYGPGPSSAGIADLYVAPKSREKKIGTQLTGFVVNEVLAQRRAVYAFADESDSATLEFYRKLGFEQVGKCYKMYFD